MLLLIDGPVRYGLERELSPWPEAAAFALIGTLTVRAAARLPRARWWHVVLFATCYLTTAIVAFIAWIMSWNE